jgi:hypothetical protein
MKQYDVTDATDEQYGSSNILLFFIPRWFFTKQ